jgi:hypothetical protein
MIMIMVAKPNNASIVSFMFSSSSILFIYRNSIKA